MVPVSVTVKTVVLNVAPAYPDGADLTQTTAKNVDLIRKYFKIQFILFNAKSNTFDTKSVHPNFMA